MTNILVCSYIKTYQFHVKLIIPDAKILKKNIYK